jgi:hypothetical protein
MLVMQISTHSPDNCPAFNPETKKATLAVMSVAEALTAKHGVKLVGQWANLGEHTIYNLYDTPSLDAYWA